MCYEWTITCLHSSQIQTILGTCRLAREPEKRIQAQKGNKKIVVLLTRQTSANISSSHMYSLFFSIFKICDKICDVTYGYEKLYICMTTKGKICDQHMQAPHMLPHMWNLHILNM